MMIHSPIIKSGVFSLSAEHTLAGKLFFLNCIKMCVAFCIIMMKFEKMLMQFLFIIRDCFSQNTKFKYFYKMRCQLNVRGNQ
ncbi:hypothetical protein CWO92_19030 [Heyndrickxia camelliae]|uniref:Uncharacterized protein n=1 Tax=Heyndrickxia camelliae TaxID=1707093 RepID=A0A2N3LFS8_9BACI|nr:hypothetical protein CWO92_19030 [Heyndrickxia camelliae]